jgi:hypothetical protein
MARSLAVIAVGEGRRLNLTVTHLIRSGLKTTACPARAVKRVC